MSYLFDELAYFGKLNIILLCIAVAAAIVLTIFIFDKKNDGKYKGAMGWIYDFVAYRKKLLKYVGIALKYIWKSLYLIGAIFITLSSVVLPIYKLIEDYYYRNPAGSAIKDFLLLLIVGNLVWRLLCEVVPPVILFIPKIIRKFFRWILSVPHRPRPFILQKGEEIPSTPDNVVTWNYFKENKNPPVPPKA